MNLPCPCIWTPHFGIHTFSAHFPHSILSISLLLKQMAYSFLGNRRCKFRPLTPGFWRFLLHLPPWNILLKLRDLVIASSSLCGKSPFVLYTYSLSPHHQIHVFGVLITFQLCFKKKRTTQFYYRGFCRLGSLISNRNRSLFTDRLNVHKKRGAWDIEGKWTMLKNQTRLALFWFLEVM